MGSPVEITVQGTPNPHAVKFTLNRTVAAQGVTYLKCTPPLRSESEPAEPKVTVDDALERTW